MESYRCTKITPEAQANLVETIQMVKIPRQCEHIKANGEFCGSPALRGRNYCYFHLTHIGRKMRAERARARAVARSIDAANVPLELPLLEDANAVQLAIMQVVDAIAQNRIDSKRAGLLLYALQTASVNLDRADFAPAAGATVAGRYENFEQDFEVGEDAPELKADEAAESQAERDAHLAKIAEIEEMAAAYAKLDAAEEEARERLHRERQAAGIPEHDSGGPFQCDHVDRFFCRLMGPLAQIRQAGAQRPTSQERDVTSRRLELLPAPDTEEGKAA